MLINIKFYLLQKSVAKLYDMQECNLLGITSNLTIVYMSVVNSRYISFASLIGFYICWLISTISNAHNAYHAKVALGQCRCASDIVIPGFTLSAVFGTHPS